MRLIYLLLLLFLFGCNEDDVVIDEKGDVIVIDTNDLILRNCLLEVRPPIGLTECDEFLSDSDFDACSTEYVGKFDLSEQGKSYMGLFCTEIGDTVSYESSQGEIANFEIIQREFITFRTSTNTQDRCNPNETATEFICYDGELAFIVMHSEELNLTLRIHSQIVLDKLDPRSKRVADKFEILEMNEVNSYSLTFQVITNKRDLDYDFFQNGESYPEIMLNDSLYRSVLSMDIETSGTREYKYYIDQENGLIAIETRQGELWTLQN